MENKYMAPNTDSGQDLAYAGGNPLAPDDCVGCTYSLCYQAEACELCPHNIIPNPEWEIERRATWIKLAMDDVIRADRARCDIGASVNSPTFQSQIKEAISTLLDSGDKLLDATNSAVAVLDEEEKGEGKKRTWLSQLVGWLMRVK